MQRKAKVAERRERRLQEKNLFDNDVVERRKREDSDGTSNDLEGEDFDYSYYYYGEGDDYEVYIGGEYLTCPFSGAKIFMVRLRKILSRFLSRVRGQNQNSDLKFDLSVEFLY